MRENLYFLLALIVVMVLSFSLVWALLYTYDLGFEAGRHHERTIDWNLPGAGKGRLIRA